MLRIFWAMAIMAIVVTFLIYPGEGMDSTVNQKILIGWLEKVYLSEYEFALTTKMDTGAKNSSMHAMDLEYIKKGKAEGSRIRFKTMDLKGRYRFIEAEVVRDVRIKGIFTKTTRPEIELEICLGGVRKRIRVNLTDRGGKNYRMILGRTALEGDFIVDVSKKFIAGSGCRKP
ncbi:MAG: ATP-dependent zinc protease [Thermodesulfobacteriota bacterium]